MTNGDFLSSRSKFQLLQPCQEHDAVCSTIRSMVVCLNLLIKLWPPNSKQVHGKTMLQSTLDTSISNAFKKKGSLRNQPSSASTKFLTSRRLVSCRQKCSPFRSNPEPTSKSGCCHNSVFSYAFKLILRTFDTQTFEQGSKPFRLLHRDPALPFETPKLKVSLVPQYESYKARK